MKVAINSLKKFLGPNPKSRSPQKGAALVEYALLLALISLVAVASVREVGKGTSENLAITQAAMEGEWNTFDTLVAMGNGGPGCTVNCLPPP